MRRRTEIAVYGADVCELHAPLRALAHAQAQRRLRRERGRLVVHVGHVHCAQAQVDLCSRRAGAQAGEAWIWT